METHLEDASPLARSMQAKGDHPTVQVALSQLADEQATTRELVANLAGQLSPVLGGRGVEVAELIARNDDAETPAPLVVAVFERVAAAIDVNMSLRELISRLDV